MGLRPFGGPWPGPAPPGPRLRAFVPRCINTFARNANLRQIGKVELAGRTLADPSTCVFVCDFRITQQCGVMGDVAVVPFYFEFYRSVVRSGIGKNLNLG